MTSNEASVSLLDNPAWHALNTHHAQYAVGTGLAKHYPPQVTSYVAVIDHSAVALRDLADIGADLPAMRFLEATDPPTLPGWTISGAFTAVQMVCESPVTEPKNDIQIIDLSESDVPDIMRLLEQTRPGPFAPRTVELGHYVGIRQQGQLVAMAGERLYPTGYREISAICTAPGFQGKGYARLLTSRLVNENWQRGDFPFLHVRPDNAPAYHLYDSLHFRKRAELQVTIMTRLAS